MNRLIVILGLIVIITGCSAYSELSPDPEIDSREDGYLEIKDDQEYFDLERGNKYYIQFPPPAEENFYLVLQLEDKNIIDNFLTTSDDFDNEAIPKIPNKYPDDPSRLVFEMSTVSNEFFWVIKNVMNDTKLELEYRYVPAWRYAFENKYHEIREILSENIVSKNIFESINLNYDTDQINFDQEIKIVRYKNETLNSGKSDLIELEGIFPSSIVNSEDTGYKDYILLKSDYEAELKFQKRYLRLLEFLNKEYETRKDMDSFVSTAPEFIRFMENAGEYPADINLKVKKIISDDLDQLLPYLKSEVNKKNDLSPFVFADDLENVETLFTLAEKEKPREFGILSQFVKRFNLEVNSLAMIDKKKGELEDYFGKTGKWPSNYFYVEAQKKIREMKRLLPESQAVLNFRYGNTNCAIKLDRKIKSETVRLSELETDYKLAEELVPRINTLRADGNYKAIIGILKNNNELDFLASQFPDLDKLSLNTQVETIETNLRNSRWSEAERGLRNLFNDTDYFDYQSIQPRKLTAVKKLEEELFNTIRGTSKSAVDTFVIKNQTALNNIDLLYQDSVFIPKYIFTFSSEGEKEVNAKNNSISEYLNNMKYVDFPENAIEKLYSDFRKKIGRGAVKEGKAIILHGKYYRGTNQKIKSIIAECDFETPKIINSAKEYRKLFVLPVTDNESGNNQFKFKVLLQIPSDADFPVFDVNIKLPEEIASGADRQQWYDKITINSVEIRNEGRVKITAPMPENDYEFQISPVQMDKGGRNILEVLFSFPEYKVFEISVMAQKPIIKKN